MAKNINFEIGYEDGRDGRNYFCPSKGNRRAEDDYALGYFAGENSVPRSTPSAVPTTP